MNKPYRKSNRVKWDDYQNGCYFVTVCTHNKHHYFGEIQNEKMNFTKLGIELQKIIKNTPLIRADQYIEIPIFTVMPNHFHMIITINNPINRHQHYFGSQSQNLSAVIRGIKCALTSFANKHQIPFKWQSRYYEHIIQNDREFSHIYDYIQNNVINWINDRFFL